MNRSKLAKAPNQDHTSLVMCESSPGYQSTEHFRMVIHGIHIVLVIFVTLVLPPFQKSNFFIMSKILMGIMPWNLMREFMFQRMNSFHFGHCISFPLVWKSTCQYGTQRWDSARIKREQKNSHNLHLIYCHLFHMHTMTSKPSQCNSNLI